MIIEHRSAKNVKEKSLRRASPLTNPVEYYSISFVIAVNLLILVLSY